MPLGPHMSFLALILVATTAVAQSPDAGATPAAAGTATTPAMKAVAPQAPATGAASVAPSTTAKPAGAAASTTVDAGSALPTVQGAAVAPAAVPAQAAATSSTGTAVTEPASAATAGATVPAPGTAAPAGATDAAPVAATPDATGATEAPAASDTPAPADEDAFAGSDDLGDEGMDEEFGGPPKLAPGFTGIWGRLVDATNGDALIEGSVKVVSGGSSKRALSDVDGYYTLALPPGTYDLRVFYELYQGRRISNVKVEAGKAVKLDVELSSDSGAIQELVVETTVDRRREAAVLQERKGAAVVSDALSSQEMSRTPDSSASDAAKRVVSLTVEDGKYVFIRGLGGRYSMTLLNGVALPSPEPDRQEVPLDIFPTSLLSSLTVFKTYDPAIPGTFGGGALQIGTSAYPSEFEASFKVGLSGDSETTFQDAYGYKGGSLDFLGWDDGTRALPSTVPDQWVDVDSRKGMPRDRVAEIGRSFTNTWALSTHRALPNLSLGATVADTLRFGNKKLGYLASVTYKKDEKIRRTEVAKLRDDDVEDPTSPLADQERVQNIVGESTASVGGLLNLGFQPGGGHEFGLTSIYSHSGEASAQRTTGRTLGDVQEVEATRLQFLTRELSFTQLNGRHRFGSLNDAELKWQGNVSFTARDEPDTRDLVYFPQEDGRSSFKNNAGSGERFYSTLDDLGAGLGADLSVPVSIVTLRAGAALQYQSREFDARRFRNIYDSGDPSYSYLAPEELFAPENFGTVIRLQEQTKASDSYSARRLVSSVYAAGEVKPWEPLRIIGGVRFENANQQLGIPERPLGPTANVLDRDDPSFIPSVNVVYALTQNLNLRAAYGYTVARPSFRELAPFNYYDFSRRRNVTGNPDLLESRIHHGDLRVEWFFGETELLAATAFAKRFINPIEQVISNDNNDVYFDNADGAVAYGGEIEARVGLGRITPALSDFRLGGNATFMASQVEFNPGTVTLQTNRVRPLQGQAPYVVNANLTWLREQWGTAVTLSYNVTGPRISDVGFQHLPDIYEQPLSKLDLSATQQLGGALRLKASVTNILDQRVLLLQGPLPVYEYRPGVAGSLQLEWSI